MLKAAWQHYHQTLAELQEKLESVDRMHEGSQHRAPGYHCLMEIQAMAYNMVIAPRQNVPRVHTYTSWNSHFYTLGQNGQDSVYGALMLDGRQTYRITGRMADVKVMLMQVNDKMLGDTGSKMIGNHDFSSFELNDNGEFEVIASATEHAGNWIPLCANSRFNFILLRRFITDWQDDFGDLHIEMLDELEDYDEFSEAKLAERIDTATKFARFLMESWAIGLYDMYIKLAGGKNQFAYIGGEDISDDIIGSPSTTYGLGIFDCAEDEAIIVECEPADSAYWAFQLGDVWSHSLDFMNFQTDINMKQAAIDADGRFRGVITHKDPGYTNWMCPLGRTEFSLVYRNYREISKISAPTTRRIKLNELAALMPADSAKTSPEQRSAAIAKRRRDYRQYLDR